MQNKLATIGLVGFLAVDVALVALALRPSHPVEADAGASTPAVVSTTPASAQTTSDSASPTTSTTSGAAALQPAPVMRLVGALDATTAWRGTTGSCDKGGATLQVTTDGGKTWDKAKSPARAVVRVQPLATDRAFAIGAGSNCDLKQYASSDAGSSWQAGTAVSGGWARQLDKATDVLTPKDERAQPCGGSTDVIDLSRTSAEQAQVLCADGAVKVTNDGGSTWSDAGAVEGGLALGNRIVSGRLSTYVARVGGDCPGIELVQAARSTKPGTVACIGTSVPAQAGEIGLSIVPEGGWLVAGDQVWTGGADLSKWTQP